MQLPKQNCPHQCPEDEIGVSAEGRNNENRCTNCAPTVGNVNGNRNDEDTSQNQRSLQRPSPISVSLRRRRSRSGGGGGAKKKRQKNAIPFLGKNAALFAMVFSMVSLFLVLFLGTLLISPRNHRFGHQQQKRAFYTGRGGGKILHESFTTPAKKISIGGGVENRQEKWIERNYLLKNDLFGSDFIENPLHFGNEFRINMLLTERRRSTATDSWSRQQPSTTTGAAVVAEDPTLMDYDAIDLSWRFDIEQEKGVGIQQLYNRHYSPFHGGQSQFDRDIHLLAEKAIWHSHSVDTAKPDDVACTVEVMDDDDCGGERGTALEEQRIGMPTPFPSYRNIPSVTSSVKPHFPTPYHQSHPENRYSGGHVIVSGEEEERNDNEEEMTMLRGRGEMNRRPQTVSVSEMEEQSSEGSFDRYMAMTTAVSSGKIHGPLRLFDEDPSLGGHGVETSNFASSSSSEEHSLLSAPSPISYHNEHGRLMNDNNPLEESIFASFSAHDEGFAPSLDDIEPSLQQLIVPTPEDPIIDGSQMRSPRLLEEQITPRSTSLLSRNRQNQENHHGLSPLHSNNLLLTHLEPDAGFYDFEGGEGEDLLALVSGDPRADSERRESFFDFDDGQLDEDLLSLLDVVDIEDEDEDPEQPCTSASLYNRRQRPLNPRRGQQENLYPTPFDDEPQLQIVVVADRGEQEEVCQIESSFPLTNNGRQARQNHRRQPSILSFTSGASSSAATGVETASTSAITSTPTAKSRRGRKSDNAALVVENGLPASPEELAEMSYAEYAVLMRDPALSQEQKALIKKIRRRGRNKAAAQKCRSGRRTRATSAAAEIVFNEEEEEGESLSSVSATPQTPLYRRRAGTIAASAAIRSERQQRTTTVAAKRGRNSQKLQPQKVVIDVDTMLKF